jgi:hypothetical protein
MMNRIKLNHYLFYLIILCHGSTLNAQDGFHIQSYNMSPAKKPVGDSLTMLLNDFQDYRVARMHLDTRQWNIISDSSHGVSFGFFDLAEKDATTGVLVKSNGEVYSTNDGWKTLNLVTNESFDGVYATSSGFVAWKGGSHIKYSSDGVNWILSQFNGGPSGRVKAVNGNRVLAYGSNGYNHSTDGGMTFDEVDISGGPVSGTIIHYYLFNDNSLGLQVGQDIHITADHGLSWSTTTLPAHIDELLLLRGDTLLGITSVASAPYEISFDKGQTFNTPAALPTSKLISSAFMYNNKLYLCQGPEMYTSTNWGQTYEHFHLSPFSATSDLRDAHARKNTVITAGDDGYYAISKDGGYTFTAIGSIGNEDLMAAFVLNDSTFFLGDRRGQVFVSNNYGSTWSQETNSSGNYHANHFSADTAGNTIVLQRNGQPAISLDGGNSFSYVTLSGGSFVHDVSSSGRLIMANGGNGNINVWDINTSSGNKTLISNITTVTGNVINLTMLDDSVGFCMLKESSSGELVIYRSTDGWNTGTEMGRATNLTNANT